MTQEPTMTSRNENPPEPIVTYIYLDDWTDEVMPCAPTLEGWAEWLSKPDEDWSRDAAEPSGAEFGATTLQVLADLEYTVTDAGVNLPPIPDGVEAVFLRYGGRDTGWCPDNSTCRGADTPEAFRQAVVDLIAANHTPPYDDSDWGVVACVASGPRQRIRYEMTADGPRCTSLGPVQ